jgi:hypothetical protein
MATSQILRGFVLLLIVGAYAASLALPVTYPPQDRSGDWYGPGWFLLIAGPFWVLGVVVSIVLLPVSWIAGLGWPGHLGPDLVAAVTWLANPVFWLGLWHWKRRPDRSGICGLCAVLIGSLWAFAVHLQAAHVHNAPYGRGVLVGKLRSGYYTWLLSIALLGAAGFVRGASAAKPRRSTAWSSEP